MDKEVGFIQWNIIHPWERKKVILSIVTTWVKRDDIILSEKSQMEKDILYDLTYMWNIKKSNSEKQNRVRGWGMKERG